MEHIRDILKKQTRTNISGDNTATWSNGEAADIPAGEACPVCKGFGFVHPRLPSGKPDYSRVVPCGCSQTASDEDRRSRLQQYSNLGPLARLTFASLNAHGLSDDPGSQEKFGRAFEAARGFAGEPEGWLVFAGPSGSGKTHLAAAIANQVIDSGKQAFYVTVPDLLDHLRSSFSPGSEQPFDQFFEQVRNASLLILDDLGVQSGTPWAKEKLDQLLNHRFNNRLPTVIVSIVPLDGLDERVRSRLLAPDFCQVYELGEKTPALSTYAWASGFELQKQMTFESFDWKRANLPPDQRENLKKAFDLARTFAESPDGWIVFQGVTGCGKTHLAAAIVNYRYQQKKPALFVVVPDFLDHLRSTFSPDSKTSYDQLFESVKSAPLLVLDDFGQQSSTPWAQEKLYQVINNRYNSRLPTVITTSLSAEEMDSPISSRFVDPRISLIFNIMAPDYRSDTIGQKRPLRGEVRGRANRPRA
ncbi:MAG: ATP-binding protein [Chloroflexi bacterium]|nr:ATP-binding protein [Chloroflexota bacterium]